MVDKNIIFNVRVGSTDPVVFLNRPTEQMMHIVDSLVLFGPSTSVTSLNKIGTFVDTGIINE